MVASRRGSKRPLDVGPAEAAEDGDGISASQVPKIIMTIIIIIITPVSLIIMHQHQSPSSPSPSSPS
jgi:hypothetical protein